MLSPSGGRAILRYHTFFRRIPVGVCVSPQSIIIRGEPNPLKIHKFRPESIVDLELAETFQPAPRKNSAASFEKLNEEACSSSLFFIILDGSGFLFLNAIFSLAACVLMTRNILSGVTSSSSFFFLPFLPLL